jgi:agmatine deiminase
MPAEWEPHAATWIAWPHNREDWPGKFSPVPWVYSEIVRHLTRGERVEILVNDGAAKKKAASCLERAGVDLDRVGFHKVPTDRVWTRDTGPSFLVNDKFAPDLALALVDWKFNGWAKYDNHQRDNRVPKRLGKMLHLERWVPEVTIDGEVCRFVLEGGAIDVNGLGSLLTTEECLLSDVQARNPGVSKDEVEKVLGEYLGVRQVIWLGEGIVGDDTHGHVDDLARFVGPKTVVTVVESDPADENHARLQDNLKRLKSAKDQDGKKLEVVTLPMPRPVVFEGQRLPASYANFYIANGVVLVPTFNDPADREALNTLAKLFPDRQIIGIHAVDLVWGLGTIHCMTQQQPAPPSPAPADVAANASQS